MNGKEKLFADFEKLALPHIDELFNFALRVTGNKKDGEKLLVEVYSRAYGFFKNLDEAINIKSWLFRIICNIILYEYSSLKRTISNNFEKIEQLYVQLKDSYSDDSQLEDVLKIKISNQELSKLVFSLPLDLKIILILNDILNFSYEEVSDLVDIPLEVLKSKIIIARKIIFIEIIKSFKVLK